MARLAWIVWGVSVWAACGQKTAEQKAPPTAPAPEASGSGSAAAGSGSAVAPGGDATAPKGLVQLRTALGIDGPNAPATVDPGATARLAVEVNGWDAKRDRMANDIRIYKIANGTPTVETSNELPAEIGVTASAWVDSNVFVVLLQDGSLFKITGGKLESIARPAASLFTATRKPWDEKLARDEDLIPTASGELWIKHCVWGARGDDDPCTSYVYVRVLPTPASAKKAPAARSQPAAVSVPDYKLTVTPLEGGKSGTLECSGPGSVTGTLAPKPDEQQFGYTVPANPWLSREPPIARIEEWGAGMDGAVASLHYLAGCTMPPDLGAVSAVRGPSGFWAVSDLEGGPGTDEAATAVFWHGRTIGVLPGTRAPVFAP